VNLPNILTIFRIFLTLIFIILYYQGSLGSKVFALAIFTLASATDYLDGYFARKHNLISQFGKIMDPIADKFLILSAFFIFTQMQLIAVWMFVVIALREVLITGLRLSAIQRGAALAAEGAGKLKTVLQIISVYLIIIYTILDSMMVSAQSYQHIMDLFLSGINILIFIVVLVTLWSGISFIRNNRKEIF